MFEMPEMLTLVRQINESLAGKVIRKGILGNTPHKFVWYNRGHDEFEKLTKGKSLGKARAKGKWLFVPLEPGYVLLLGECGGKVLYHPPNSEPPAKYHLCLAFEDGSHFTATTQMWGAMELHEAGREEERKYVKGMRPTPVDPEFTYEYFSDLIDSLLEGEKRSVKGLLTQDQLVPGLGNAIAQDIMFRSHLSPRCALEDLNKSRRRELYNAILKIVREAIKKSGRYDEYDLYHQKGKYIRLMDNKAVGKPCPECGDKIEKIQYLGGACYFCPGCQKLR